VRIRVEEILIALLRLECHATIIRRR